MQLAHQATRFSDAETLAAELALVNQEVLSAEGIAADMIVRAKQDVANRKRLAELEQTVDYMEYYSTTKLTCVGCPCQARSHE